MSSQSQYKLLSLTKTRSDDVKLTERFSEQMAQLCMNDDYSDVTFIVENQRLPAHRVILAARSEYFRALLFGGLCESRQSEIEMQIPVEAFKALLKYIYSGHMPLAQMDEDNILDTLGLANQYGFSELEHAISQYLRQYLALNNVCAILDAARLYNLDKLTEVCLTFMDRNAALILQHESFKALSMESLKEILRRDSFFAPEVDIFLAVWEWCKNHTNINIDSVVSFVRLPLMKLEDLLQTVRPSGILDADKLLDAIQEQTTSKYLPYRAALWPEENVATAKFHSRTILGECRAALLDGDFISYDMEKGYTRHCIGDNIEGGITVELGTICIINHIKLLLWDRDNRSYSYYIEVSANSTNWDRVIDYSQYYCRSWQFLYFSARPVRYIKLVGTHNTVNKVFHVVGLEAMYTASLPKVINGIVAPTANVARTDVSAIVVDGVSRTRNALLNGDYVNYDWDSGYTCHQLGSGEIVVRLGQPYIIGSMRLLLWDCDDRTYSFYIETSVNQKDWHMIVDKRNEQVRSWQNFSFTPRPIVFIRIVGTRNTANEIFHCVHLECPSQDPNFLQLEKEKEQELRANSKITDGAAAGDDSNDVTAGASNAASNGGVDGVCSNQPSNNEPLPDDVLIGLDNISVDGN
ncbi:BTB/POZ domain-containing protein 9 [Bactrocera neohumeralis]|uniref:BTB/POZ domain-containing protein 9 n=1 Tax=Bactrocera tryoni TaxID=59916 RepID=UPI001A9A045F|nr:BTB/POZ domain-containing protein 9 [Bactrocera tryoni]XP_050327794.1 BTB/POZ domain-containing protein 9 [Bactrocera neohumeralis]